jgi:ABC-type amino acid transport substrate-binding protein
MRRSKCLAIGLIYFMVSSYAVQLTAEEQTVRLNAASGAKADYVIELLNLAFANIDTHYRIKKDLTPSTQSRITEEVQAGNLDLMWVSTSQTYETDFLPIRIPLLKGLLGYRILLIRAEEQQTFDAIYTKEDLARVTFGQGRTWADAGILEANGVKVIKATKSPGLFHMLDGGRFDAFPRGASEPFAEIKKYPELKLAVEKNLLLAYKMPFYIFVNKNKPNLAKDIELGLNRAIATGEFDKIFLQNPTVKDVQELAHLSQRRIINLDNPTLPPQTPIDRTELWIDPKSF